MHVFRPGDIVDRSFQTSHGAVEMLAEVIEGATLHLKDIAIYPTGSALDWSSAHVRYW
jgi:hypothetical protein